MPSPTTPKKTDGVSSLFRDVRKEVRTAQGNDARIFNILEYIEQPWGLQLKLFPAQRFVVKLFYNIPLDETLPEDTDRQIKVTDMFNTKVLYTFTEREYLDYLFNEGRCNISTQDHDRRELILALGRRSGKTTLSGIFASYEVYRLLNLWNPQQFYGLPNGNRIQIISVATDKDQASLLFNEVTSHLTRCDYFKPFVSSDTMSRYDFRTPYDIEKFGSIKRHGDSGKFESLHGKATLRVTFRPCVAKGLRGAGNIMVILDEVAHFQNKGQASAKDIYDAVTPSTAAFSEKNQDTGLPIDGQSTEVDSRIVLISSPLGKSGKFYELYDLAMSGGEGSENLLAIQAPTWEINPTVPTSYYKQKYHADPTVFAVEHGAQFSDQVQGWIEREEDLLACVDPQLRPLARGRPKDPHQMGIDVGLVGDGTAIAITKIVGDRIVLVYHEIWYAGTPWRESNPHLKEPVTDYAKTIEGVVRLDFDEIGQWIFQLSRRFHITDALFDRWNGIPLEQKLHKRGLKKFKSEFFTRDQNSKIYQAAKTFLFDERLVLYDYPIPKSGDDARGDMSGNIKHSPLIAEMLTLQQKQVSKNIVLVEAPQKAHAHDDQSDALVRAIWLSIQRLVDTKYTAGQSPWAPKAPSPVTVARYQTARARKHGGFGPRTVPSRLGLRRRG